MASGLASVRGTPTPAGMLLRLRLCLGSLAVFPARVADIQTRSLTDQIVNAAIELVELLQAPDSRWNSELPPRLTLGHMVP